MAKEFRIQIPSSCPEIDLCEVLLPKGKDQFDTGWMVTRLISNAFADNKIIVSAAVNPPNIQINATMDSTKTPLRVAVLLGKTEPLDRKIFEVTHFKSKEKVELVVYWSDWKIQKAEWNGIELIHFKAKKGGE